MVLLVIAISLAIVALVSVIRLVISIMDWVWHKKLLLELFDKKKVNIKLYSKEEA